MKDVEKSIGTAAARIARDIKADCIVSIGRNVKLEFDDSNKVEAKVTVFREIKPGTYTQSEYKQTIIKPVGGSISPIKKLLATAISKKLIRNREKVVCVINENLFSIYKGILFVFDVDKVFFNISLSHLAEDINPEIIETIINICLELIEGREDKKVGTAFIIGDYDKLRNYAKQLIINPFEADSNKERYITDPSIKETIKEFSQLDGAFIIDKMGIIKSAGTYINVDTGDISNFHGFGTKHRTCAALTSKTDAIAIVLSQSGEVNIFKKGSIIIKLP